ncbi:MAG: TIGR02452 family protein [Oscillospiraceae bacterium]|nr:TIGR02452 family protein [Oscillospiraceae bacterium]
MANEIPENEQLKQLAAQMRTAEYGGLSEEEIQEKERQKELRRKRNIEVLEDTLNILEKGSYQKGGQNVRLHFPPEQIRRALVFLPDELAALSVSEAEKTYTPSAPCSFSCENEDALALAQRLYQRLKSGGESAPKILVQNMASAAQAGGHTRKGADAQEEDLCRRSSLLLSLESDDAKRYYDYNNALGTRMGSDAVVLSPCVEVIKDTAAETLSQPFPVSVISCAAPMVRLGLEGMSRQEYENMLYRRIQGILLTAAAHNYRHLILGAFGCGVYGNDAAIISDLFSCAIRDFTYDGKSYSECFSTIQFAVLCHPDRDYNYKEFCRNFSSR